jgi:hypothetical protein
MGFSKLALDPPLVPYAILQFLLYLTSSQNTDTAFSGCSAHLCKISNGLNTNMANFQDLEATQVKSRNELKPLVSIANYKVYQFDSQLDAPYGWQLTNSIVF